MKATNLEEYMNAYGGLLGQQAAKACRPLHTPGEDPLLTPPLLRPPFPAQEHVIAAAIKALRRQQAIQIAAQMGTGKTLLSLATIQGHARGAYRAMIFCPPHLTHKWDREIRETIPNANVFHVEGYHSLTKCRPGLRPFGRTFWIVSNTRAKLGTTWEPAAARRPGMGHLFCPDCYADIVRVDPKTDEVVYLDRDDLEKKQHWCQSCGGALWQWTSKYDRWPVAHYVHKHLKRFFQYLVIDESHQTKSADSAIGQAMGSLVAACNKTICLTGTMLGGYAWHVRPLLFRMAPQSLLEEGLGWNDETLFNERYGRMERKVVETEKVGGRSHRQSVGRSSTKTTKYVRPGVMPGLFGKHLIQNSIFLSLEELADNLPPLVEQVIDVPMGSILGPEYERIEKALSDAVKSMLQKKDKRMLSKMLHTLLGYCDHPWDWGEIGYFEPDGDGGMEYVHVVTPADMDQRVIWPKEEELLRIIREENAQGRQCWVYTVMTDKRDVASRLCSYLQGHGLLTDVLRSSVETGEREAWIAKHGPHLDVCISHPQLVETGLDLFDKGGGHNFATIIFYSTGYNLFTLRQAAARAWRIGQRETCKVIYLSYAATMQARAMSLMGKKLSASLSLDGKFSAEGLAALAGDEGSLDMALARSLVNRLDDLDVGRAWEKLTAAKALPPAPSLKPAPARPVIAPRPLVPALPKQSAEARQLTMF